MSSSSSVGRALLDVPGTRLRREPASPPNGPGATVRALGQAIDEHRDRLPDTHAAVRQLAMIRQELCAARPRRVQRAGYVEERPGTVSSVGELTAAVERCAAISALSALRLGHRSLT